MKKLTGALVLSFSLLLASGCRSAGETKDPEDASTPTAGAVDAAKGALEGGTATGSTGSAQPAEGVNLGGMKSDSGTGSTAGAAGTGSTTGSTGTGSTGVAGDPAAANPASKGTGDSATALPASEEARAAQEACVDKWLNGKKMDRYGHAEGTMYMGGSPLFNEQTGESTDRLEYVYKRQPEAKKACAAAAGQKTAPKK
jgi:hypothetical protein